MAASTLRLVFASVLLRSATPASRPLTTQNTSHCINVRDFGAKGDGITDDSDAIQVAIDSRQATYVGWS